MKNSFYLFALIAFLTSSCAFHTGSLSGIYTDLDNPYQITGKASGHAQTGYFLGMGGVTHDQLVEEAKNDLHRSVVLPEGSILANYSINFKNSFYLIYAQTDVYITADIISARGYDEALRSISKNISSKISLTNQPIIDQIENGKSSVSPYGARESVLYFSKKDGKYKKASFSKKKGDVISLYILPDESNNTFSIDASLVFKKRRLGDLDGIIGETIRMPQTGDVAKIKAYCPKTSMLLVKTATGSLKTVLLTD